MARTKQHLLETLDIWDMQLAAYGTKVFGKKKRICTTGE